MAAFLHTRYIKYRPDHIKGMMSSFLIYNITEVGDTQFIDEHDSIAYTLRAIATMHIYSMAKPFDVWLHHDTCSAHRFFI